MLRNRNISAVGNNVYGNVSMKINSVYIYISLKKYFFYNKEGTLGLDFGEIFLILMFNFADFEEDAN